MAKGRQDFAAVVALRESIQHFVYARDGVRNASPSNCKRIRHENPSEKALSRSARVKI